jgi:hypothetical protein
VCEREVGVGGNIRENIYEGGGGGGMRVRGNIRENITQKSNPIKHDL